MRTLYRSTLGAAGALFVLAVGASLAVNDFTGQGGKKALLGGALLNGLVLYPFFKNTAVSDWLKRTSWIYKLILSTFFFLAVAGHGSNRPFLTFPFVTWDMYHATKNTDVVDFYETVGLNLRGERALLNPAAIYRPMINGRIHRKLLALLEGPETDKIKLDQTLAAIGREYSRQHPENRLVAVEVYACKLRLQSTDSGDIDRVMVRHVNIAAVGG